MVRQPFAGFGKHVQPRARRHVIEHHRQRAFIRDARKIGIQPGLGSLVIIGSHAQLRIGPMIGGKVRAAQGDAQVIAARAHDHPHAARDARQRVGGQSLPFRIAERAGFTRGAGNQQRVNLCADLPFQQPIQGRIIDLPAAKRRDHRGAYACKQRRTGHMNASFSCKKPLGAVCPKGNNCMRQRRRVTCSMRRRHNTAFCHRFSCSFSAVYTRPASCTAADDGM